MDLQDQSASSYDMSLANLAALAGWTDQEIANLVIAWRRENKEDLVKALRRDYIMRTIAKARSGIHQDKAITTLAAAAEKIVDSPRAQSAGEPDGALPPDSRRKVLAELSKLLGVEILRWVQHGRENARYSLQLADQSWVRMGAAADVLSASKFRTRLYEAARRLITAVKPKQWDDVARCLAACVELVENEEASSAYQAEQWVASYLSDHLAVTGDEWQEAAATGEPFLKDQKIHIHAGELRKHMRVLQHETTVTHVELCDCLKVSGFTRVSMTFRQKGEVLRRSLWAAPHTVPIRDEATALQETTNAK